MCVMTLASVIASSKALDHFREHKYYYSYCKHHVCFCCSFLDFYSSPFVFLMFILLQFLLICY